MNFDEIAKRVAGTSSKPLATTEELDKLRAFEKAFIEAAAIMNKHTVLTAHQDFAVHQSALKAAVVSGTLDDHDGWTRQDFEEDALQKSNAAKAAMKEITNESSPLAREICERFCALANQTAGAVECAESSEFLKWGVDYRPSALVEALKKLPELMRRRVPSSGLAEVQVSRMLPYLNLE